VDCVEGTRPGNSRFALARGESRFWDGAIVIRFRFGFGRKSSIPFDRLVELVAALERRTRSEAAARDARPRRSFATRDETGSWCSEVLSRKRKRLRPFQSRDARRALAAKKYLSSIIHQNARVA